MTLVFSYFSAHFFPVLAAKPTSFAPRDVFSRTHYADRFYELRIHCTDKYPAEPPQVRFISKINMDCVDKQGRVIPSKLPAMRNWNRNMGIEQVLQSIRSEMCSDRNRRTRQPADGLTYE
jgi:ubiquitin-protein ligase